MADERDFDDPGIGEALALIDDVVRWAVDFGPPGVRHHAVGAELVAAPSDTNVCRSVGTFAAGLESPA